MKEQHISNDIANLGGLNGDLSRNDVVDAHAGLLDQMFQAMSAVDYFDLEFEGPQFRSSRPVSMTIALMDSYRKGANTEARLPEPFDSYALLSDRLSHQDRKQTALALWAFYGNTDRFMAEALQNIFGDDRAIYSECAHPWTKHYKTLSGKTEDFAAMEPKYRMACVEAFMEGVNSSAYVPMPGEMWDEPGSCIEEHYMLQEWRARGSGYAELRDRELHEDMEQESPRGTP